MPTISLLQLQVVAVYKVQSCRLSSSPSQLALQRVAGMLIEELQNTDTEVT